MNRILAVLALLILAICLTGCMSYYVTINTKQDGTQQPVPPTGAMCPLDGESTVACDKTAFNQSNTIQVSGGGNEKPIKVETAREAQATLPLK